MLAVGPLGPQYCLLFAWYELGRQVHLGVDTLPSQRVPQKILKKSISLYYMHCHGPVKLKPQRPASKKSWISITVWTTTHTLYPPYHCVDHCAAKDIFKVSANIHGYSQAEHLSALKHAS